MGTNKTTGIREQETNKQDTNQITPSNMSNFLQKNAQLKKISPYLIDNPYAEAGVRIFVTSLVVSTVCYPIDFIQNRQQMGIGLRASLALFNGKNISLLLSGYTIATKASLMKNSIVSNKEKVSNHVDSAVGEKVQENNNSVQKYKTALLASGIIASVDTLFTQYYSNLRIVSSLGYKLSLTTIEKFRLGTQGLVTRGARNYSTALVCVGSAEALNGFTGSYLPEGTNQYVQQAVNSFIAAIITAPFINTLEVIYRNQIKSIDFKTLATPYAKDIIKELWSQGGASLFLRGTVLGGLSNAMYFIVISLVALRLDEYFPPRQARFTEASQSTNTFFAKTRQVKEPTKKDLKQIEHEIKEQYAESEAKM